MQHTFKQRATTAIIGMAATVCAFCTAAFAGDQVGYAELSIEAPHHGRAISGAIWYPAGAGGTAEMIAENPVFHGVPILWDAEPEPGRHPIILLSHGMGGNIRSLSWLAAELSRHGAIVVGVNHPGSTYGDMDMVRLFNHGTRVQDLQAGLDFVLADPRFRPQADPSRAYVVGFSLGGWTALSIAGVTGDVKAYARLCATVMSGSEHCGQLKTWGVDLGLLDSQRWDRSYKDTRIKGVAAIDPGLLYGLSAANVAALVQPVALIGLGAGEYRLQATDFSPNGSGFAALVPDAKVVTIAPAFHFSALPECKPEAAVILVAEKDDPVCTDPAGTNRAKVHAEIIEAIASTFKLN